MAAVRQILDNNGLVNVDASSVTYVQKSRVTRLYLARHRLTSIDGIGALDALLYAYLNDNLLEELPAEIGSLPALIYLDVSANLLTSLPAEIGLLSNLATLYADDNTLTSLPREINGLTKITRLYLHGNRLTDLPAELQLTSPTTISVLTNNLCEGSLDAGLVAWLDARQPTWRTSQVCLPRWGTVRAC